MNIVLWGVTPGSILHRFGGPINPFLIAFSPTNFFAFLTVCHPMIFLVHLESERHNAVMLLGYIITAEHASMLTTKDAATNTSNNSFPSIDVKSA